MRTRTKITLARLVFEPILFMRKLFGLGGDLVVTRHGLRWALELNEGIDFSIFLLGSFEPATVKGYRKLVKPGSTIFDIGANVGAHTLPLAQIIGVNGQVHAFEPTNYAFDKLTRNIELNPNIAERIIVNQTMLTDQPDRETPEELYSSWPLGSEGGLHPKHRGRLMSTERANTMTLDNYVEVNDIKKLDFIKIDVDGYECQVFRGARQTLKRFRPIIQSEFAPYVLAEAGESVGELVNILTALNYRFLDPRTKRVFSNDAEKLEMIVADGASMNILAWPEELLD